MKSPIQNPILSTAAIMTWAAAVWAEWPGLNPELRPLFALCALGFVTGFIYLDLKRPVPGWNWALLLQMLTVIALIIISGFGLMPALYVILGTQLYERLPRRDLVFVLVVLNAVLLIKLLNRSSLGYALAGFAAYAGFQIFGLMNTINSSRLSAANQALAASNAELSATRVLLAESERASERLMLSRELHDLCGHKLTALKLTLRAATGTGALSGESLQLASQLTDELLNDIRGVVSTLRQHESIDLGQALKALSRSWQQPKVEVEMDPEVVVRQFSLAQTLLRVAQEACTNAAKHGAANQVLIRLTQSHAEQSYQLEVIDDGRVELPFQLGNGLRGMQERVEQLQGTLEFLSNRDKPKSPKGLTVRVSFPIPETETP